MFTVEFDLMDAYEVFDDVLIFGGVALTLFGQLWGIALVVLGLAIMALKGEISLGGGGGKKELSEEERKYFEYTGEAENEFEGDAEGEEGDEGEGDDE